MIKLERQRTAAAIVARYRGSLLRNKLRKLLRDEIERNQKLAAATTEEERKQIGPRKIDTGFWTDAKPQLSQESHTKCAYCESKARPGQVEHFRPKSVYWWLAYCYDNYAYSCGMCNARKLNHFPLFDETRRLPAPALTGLPANPTEADLDSIVASMSPDPLDTAAGAAFLAMIETEDGTLINPYLIDPAPLFSWELVPNKVSVKVTARATEGRLKKIAEAAIKLCALNNEDLQKERWLKYEDALEWKELFDFSVEQALEETRERAVNNIRRLMEPRQEFAGMVRYFATEEWQIVV
jgi:5-methylcytosine-specific restriction endonuclease McrA